MCPCVGCELVKCYIWNVVFYGAETWTFRKLGQKYLKRFEMWYSRRMEKTSGTDRVKNEVLHSIKEERNILHTVERRKANWIGHVLRRNYLLKHVI
jgi:hypothetical protein